MPKSKRGQPCGPEPFASVCVTWEVSELKGTDWHEAGEEVREPWRDPSVCSHSTLAVLSVSVDVACPECASVPTHTDV